jgi:membrane protein
VFGPETAHVIQDAVNAVAVSNSSGSLLATIISFVALLLAASGLFFQLQYALNTIWHVPPPERGQTGTFIRQRLFSFLMVLAVGLMLVVAVVVNFMLNWLGSLLDRLFGIGGTPVSLTLVAAFGLIVLALALIYKYVPEVKIGWRDVWAGSLLTALLVILSGFVVAIYFRSGGVGSALEAAGAFSIVVISIYYVAQIFLLGAVLTRVYAETYGSRRDIDLQGPAT